ncbi:protein kinase subdomain-containing protein PKL/ccin3 [Coprinopsis sp. MPI-PUGE-AT-0042]|nr:protein kinase subdomain-containing protein PKL/ccin3 [Coprinopsis sp. MPI-PUGE-AT-0042]
MASLNDSTAVPQNAIKVLTIVGWAKNTLGRPVSVQFTRQEPNPVEPVRAWRGEVLPNGPPPRPPSQLPAPGSNELTVSVNQVLADGRCGTTFSVDAMRMTNPTNPSSRLLYPKPPHLPELVIKYAPPDRAERLTNEAGIYNEMEVLQGVSIPRCYGLFTAELAADVVIPSLHLSRCKKTITVLLLERVGEPLPLGDKLPEEGDLWDVFRDLARLGIEQNDIRYSNILQAPYTADSLSGNVCPFHGTIHHYRLVDFGSARKTDLTLKRHYYNTLEHLGPVLEDIKQSIVREPTDVRNKAERPSAL